MRINRARVLLAAGVGLLLATTGMASAGDKRSAPAPAPARPAPAAPAQRGAAPQAGNFLGAGRPEGNAGVGQRGGGNMGGAHTLSGKDMAPPSHSGIHPIARNEPPGRGPGRPETPNKPVTDKWLQHPPGPDRPTRGGNFGRGPETSPTTAVGPGVREPVGVPAGAGALAEHHLAEHREEFARLHGPGHDAVRDRAFVAAHAHDFHTRDVRLFNDRELAVWRGGRWYNDWHYGRWGWWYAVGDVWYPYAEPIYPYPVEVADIVVPDATIIDQGPGVIVESGDPTYVPGPVAVSVASPTGMEVIVRPLPPAPVVNYRCATPTGVYPDVHLCPTTWTIVP